MITTRKIEAAQKRLREVDEKFKTAKKRLLDYEEKNSIHLRKSNYGGCKKCGSSVRLSAFVGEECPVCGADMRSKTVLDTIHRYQETLTLLTKTRLRYTDELAMLSGEASETPVVEESSVEGKDAPVLSIGPNKALFRENFKEALSLVYTLFDSVLEEEFYSGRRVITGRRNGSEETIIVFEDGHVWTKQDREV